MDNIYKNIILLQNDYKIQLEYWIKKLSGKIKVINFPYSYINNNGSKSKIRDVEFMIPNDVSKYLLKISNNNDFALFVELVTIIKILIYKYSNDNNIGIISPILNNNLLNNYNNKILLFTELDENETVKSLLIKEKNSVIDAYRNGNYVVEEYLKKLISDENEIKEILEIGIELTNIHGENKIDIDNMNIFFSFERDGELIKCKFRYNEFLVSEELGISIQNSLINILNSINNHLNIRVGAIELVSKSEKNRIIYGFNETMSEYRKNVDVVELFEEQAQKNYNKKAVIFKDKYLTYGDLNKESNRVARYLKLKKVKNNDIVGIISDNSMEVIIYMIGILKAGATYLPIDISTPVDRLNYILKDSDVRKVLVNDKTKINYNIKVELVDRKDIKNEIIDDNLNLNIKMSNSDLVYLIYTSGTTGLPKGVSIKNESLINYISWFTNFANIKANDKTVLVSSFAFDLGYTIIYSALLNGCELHILDKDNYTNLNYLLEYIYSNEITYFKLTPSLFKLIVEYDENSIEFYFKSTRLVVLGGESIIPSDLEKFHNKYSKVEFINHYGPTEATIGCIADKIDFSNFSEYKRNPTLGQPIDNMKIYILDKKLKPVPLGVRGYIYVSGIGISRGYFNNETLTNEKFIKNPYVENQLMYKTEDMGVYIGNKIKFLGREDNQVSVSGYRVEINGVEEIIRNYPNVKDAVVLLSENKLVAYVVGRDINIIKLKDYMKKRLMNYMIPTIFNIVDKTELTVNGKVDKNKLKKYNSGGNGKYKKPRNKIEKFIADAWKEILNVDSVGIYDDYFNLGGDSIKAIQIVSFLQNNDISCKVSDIMEYTTIDELADHVKINKNYEEQSLVTGEVFLTPIQKRFFEYNYKEMNHWNQSVMVYRDSGFDEDAIKVVFSKILEHHDALRMSYYMKNSEIHQINKELYDNMYCLDIFNIENKDYEKEIEEKSSYIQSQLNLKNGPIVRLALFTTNKGDYLLIIIHHLVVDGVSWRILLKDFSDGYDIYLKSKDVKFVLKTASFKKWSDKLNGWAKKSKWINEIEYWKSIEKNDALDVPENYNNSIGGVNKNSSNISVIMSEEKTRNILQEVNKTYNTETKDILLIALGYSLKEWIGKDRILLNIEGHGREEIDNINITRTVGWFTTVFPIVLDMGESENISMKIRTVKEMIRNIPNKGIGYGILRYLVPFELKKGVELKLNPRVCFNYLGHMDNDIDDKVFKISNISTGNTLSPNAKRQYFIHINAMIVNKKLIVDFNYDNIIFEKSDINRIAEKYKQALYMICEHCINKNETILTPSDITKNNITIDELDYLADKCSNVVKKNIDDIYDVTPMQAVMYNLAKNKKDPTIYYQCRTLTINKSIDIDQLQECYNIILEQHDILRTNFIETSTNEIIQVTYKNYHRAIIFVDISDLDINKQKEYFIKLKEQDRLRGFNLNNGDTMRVFILKLSEFKYKLLWSNHHIILDGWSRMILIRDFVNTLEEVKKNKNYISKRSAKFKEYIKWLKKQDILEADKFWSSVLDGYTKKPIVKYIADKDSSIPIIRKELVSLIDENKIISINDILKKEKITMNSVFNTIWGIILLKLHNVEDIAFCAPAAARIDEVENVNDIVGMTMNLIPIRANKRKYKTFKELALSIEKIFIDSQKFAYYSLENCGEAVYDSNIFECCFCYENYPIDNKISDLFIKSGIISDIEAPDSARVNLILYVMPFNNKLNIKLSYNSSKLSGKYMKWMLDSIENIIDIIISRGNMNMNIDKILF